MRVELQETVSTQDWNSNRKILDERSQGAGLGFGGTPITWQLLVSLRAQEADSENVGTMHTEPNCSHWNQSSCQGEKMLLTEIRDKQEKADSFSLLPPSSCPLASLGQSLIEPAGKAKRRFSESHAQLTEWSIKERIGN